MADQADRRLQTVSKRDRWGSVMIWYGKVCTTISILQIANIPMLLSLWSLRANKRKNSVRVWLWHYSVSIADQLRNFTAFTVALFCFQQTKDSLDVTVFWVEMNGCGKLCIEICKYPSKYIYHSFSAPFIVLLARQRQRLKGYCWKVFFERLLSWVQFFK